MRRRLMSLVFASTLLALTLLGVILMAVIWTATVSATQDRAAATARVAASALEDAVEAGATVDEADLVALVRDEAHLVAVLPDGRTLSSGPAPSGPVYSATSSAGGVSVTAGIPRSVNVARVSGQAGLVVAISVVALVLAMVMAYFYARRLTRPLEDFADVAARIATGDRRVLSQRYDVPELDAVADVLDRGVTNFNSLLENERRITNEASHQLRTPLTALSLRLEEILATDDLGVVHAEATAALGQVERLSGVIDQVVGLSRGNRVATAEKVHVDELVGGQIIEWSPAFEASGRVLRRWGMNGLVVEVMPGAQSQALATLVENSLVHGEGTTTIGVRSAGDWVVLEVSDEGPGVPEELGSRVFERSVSGASSSGLGLALARTLVSADGGRLELVSSRPAVFAMFLPSHEPAHGADSAELPDGQALVETAASGVSASAGNTQRR